MSTLQPSEFARAFSEAVETARHRLDKLKKELAHDCGMRPDRFSHLQSGMRRPTHKEVVQIGRGLRLDEAATNRLLETAGFPPLSSEEDQAEDVSELVGRLPEPERPIARAEIEHDLQLVRRAWALYGSWQAENQARDWADASGRRADGIELYWELRAMAARVLGQVNLAAAAASPHLNRLAEAEQQCQEGLEAVTTSGSRPFQVMLLARLASIRRLRSDYEGAGHLYERALGVIDDWRRDDGAPARQRRDNEAWRVHWTARVRRMQGTLELFKGQPADALGRLETSLEHFKSSRHRDELAQVCYGLGWAHGLRGDVERAASWDRRGLEHAMEHNRATGREDQRSLLQGHLYLGGDYLDLQDLPRARAHLEQAQRLAGQRSLSQYHEVGRVHLLLGKLQMLEGDFERAHATLRTALEFFSAREEQVLLATAHNAMGDLYLRMGQGSLHRALDGYQRALRAARASRPPNTYYECAALVNICRVRVREALPGPELAGVDPASETGQPVEKLLVSTRELGRLHGYRNHRARLAVVQADWALRRGDRDTAVRLADDAIHMAHNFSPQLLSEVHADLAGIGLPRELTVVVVRGDDEG